MKRLIPISLLFAIILAMAHGATPVYADSIQDSQNTTVEYVYAITPESDNWDSYSVVEKVVMLQIPDSKLAAMSNDELVAALASYPYLVDIYLYGDCVQDGVEIVSTYCSALNELLKRDPELNSIKNYLSSSTSYISTMSAAGTSEADSFENTALLDIYLSTADTQETFSSNANRAAEYVYTPNGTAVRVREKAETHTTTHHREVDAELVQSVYHAELIEQGTCLYNCHYYAWHLNGNINTNQLRTMTNPSAYMTDGSYNSTYTGNINAPHCATNIRNGDVIFYSTLDHLGSSHSAICVETSITGNAIEYIHCISKWGEAGLFMHDLGSVPAGYNTSTISAWRLA
ncbi:MAG: hypothetical protein IJ388_04030 [Oscillospiraceae bacterium]|nr:hypothetical protein [Oscillospiraceae bacterium]